MLDHRHKTISSETGRVILHATKEKVEAKHRLRSSGYFAWKRRPACRRQRDDIVLLAQVRKAFALSNGTYDSPRLTRELR
jgi:hypothetical protein